MIVVDASAVLEALLRTPVAKSMESRIFCLGCAVVRRSAWARGDALIEKPDLLVAEGASFWHLRSQQGREQEAALLQENERPRYSPVAVDSAYRDPPAMTLRAGPSSTSPGATGA